LHPYTHTTHTIYVHALAFQWEWSSLHALTSFLSAVIVPKADLKTASQHFTGS